MAPILRIAVPSPLRRLFDYLPPAGEAGPFLAGQRLAVPFGRGAAVGVLLEVAAASAVPAERLRPAERLLDREPLLSDEVLGLLRWAADYYHHPPGEVLAAALPVALRQGQPAWFRGLRVWHLTAAGAAAAPDARARRQAALLARLRAHPQGLSEEELNRVEAGWRAPMQRLAERGWVAAEERGCLPQPGPAGAAAPEPNPGQRQAIAAIDAAAGFAAFLLDGVTGSGKTEVYLRVIEPVLRAGRQVLVLVPEIGLTPQLVGRFRERFALPVAVLHSGLSDGERLCAWLAVRDGRAPLVVGTRSAVLAPFRDLGLIVVDEEHDGSYKQQEGFRYHARDLAVYRARSLGIPIVLGSATPSLESLHNAGQGRYQRLHLPQRAGAAAAPHLALLDLRHQPYHDGLSAPLLVTARRHLEAGGQVLLFLNRRGYAPTLLCHECGWIGQCERCDAHLILYARGHLRCHHCGAERPVPVQCPTCGSVDLRAVGQGTERVEEAVQRELGAFGVVRIDRDSTRRKGSLEQALERVAAGADRVLVGTQMLAKGHHFPLVTLVGILDGDSGLFSTDFRAPERMAQLIVQVAGRAGRAERPGEVVIQTHRSDHPLLQSLLHGDYHAFARAALAERRAAALPPFAHLALLRAEAVDEAAPYTFLERAAEVARAVGEPVNLWGPVPAPMERRAGRHRAQLLLHAERRGPLQKLLAVWAGQLEGIKEGRRVRWSLDVDPVETA